MKLYVKNFGKIEEAKIDLNKFNIFLGDNNSGKTYLTTLIYGLMTLDFFKYMLITDFSNCDDYKKLEDKLKNLIDEEKNKKMSKEDKENLQYKLYAKTEQKVKEILSLIPEQALEKIIDKLEVEQNIKNFLDSFAIEAIEQFINDSNNSNMKTFISINITKKILDYIPNIINYTLQHNKEKIIKDIFNFDIKIEEIKLLETSYKQGEIIPYTYSSYRFENLDKLGFITFIHNCLYKFDFRLPDATYLPIARTGFLLFKDDILNSIVDYRYKDLEENAKKGLLTKPCIDFVKDISVNLKDYHFSKKFDDIISYMKKDILHGKVIMRTSATNDFYFKPDAMDKELTMHVSSGVVTELTSLVTYLRHSKNLDMLIMEEPETCLHPTLQQEIAKCLIRLYNKGLPILISTHSDIILQHMTNMTNLYNIKNLSEKKDLMKEFNYIDDDLINSDDINLYQFDTNKDKDGKTTIITELDRNKYGFVIPSFIDALRNFSNETLDLYPKDDDDE